MLEHDIAALEEMLRNMEKDDSEDGEDQPEEELLLLKQMLRV